VTVTDGDDHDREQGENRAPDRGRPPSPLTTGEQASWVPRTVDTTHASPARMYARLLGDKHHFAVDRETLDEAAQIAPWAVNGAKANRTYLRAAVQAIAIMGDDIEQILDMGSGLPTSPNIHEMAPDRAPRVLYVDNDATALAHARARLADAPAGVGVLDGDLLHPDRILDDIERYHRDVIDLKYPVGLILSAVLHFIPNDQRPERIVARLVNKLAPGSCVVITHLMAGIHDERSQQVRAAAEAYSANSTAPLIPRTRAEIEAFFDGLTMVDPVRDLRYGGEIMPVLGGIGVKRGADEPRDWTPLIQILDGIGVKPDAYDPDSWAPVITALLAADEDRGRMG